TAAPDGPAAPVEEPEPDLEPAADARDRALRLVERPVRHPVAAVLVRVRIAEHHLLHPAPREELADVDRVREKEPEEVLGAIEVGDRLEEGDDVERAGDGAAALHPPESGFLQ